MSARGEATDVSARGGSEVDLGEGCGHLAGELAGRILGSEGTEKACCGGLLVLVAKLPEGIQSELSGVPERVVAVAARRKAAHDRFEVADHGAG